MNLPQSAHWSFSIVTAGFAVGLADLYQCVYIILMTPVGSDPTRPTFGSRVFEYLDWPIDRARPHVVRETVEAIRLWERRLTPTRVQVEQSQGGAGMLIRTFFKLATGPEQSFDFVVVRP